MSDQEPIESPIDAQLAAPPAYGYDEDTQTPKYEAAPRRDLIQSRSAVLALLFLVTGALGIPLLWMNRQFSNLERVVWSIIVTLYTIALIAIAVWIVMWAYGRVVAG